jgi:hypothetical protein
MSVDPLVCDMEKRNRLGFNSNVENYYLNSTFKLQKKKHEYFLNPE